MNSVTFNTRNFSFPSCRYNQETNDIDVNVNAKNKIIYSSSRHLLDVSYQNMCVVKLRRYQQICNDLGYLRTLLLDGNSLTRLPDDISLLNNLTRLEISQNKLSELHWLENLTILIAHHNKLTSEKIDKRYLTSSTLTNLDLSHNEIRYLPLKCPSLIDLSLSDNEFQEIQELHCPKLENLDLSNNKIKDLLPLKNLHSLKCLTLDGNNIQELPAIFVSFMPLLEELCISFNERLKSLPLFPKLKLLRANDCSLEQLSLGKIITHLEANKNKLRRINLSSNILLKEIHLASNFLSEIVLPNTTSLNVLVLGDNKFESIGNIPPMIEELIISNNPMRETNSFILPVKINNKNDRNDNEIQIEKNLFIEVDFDLFVRCCLKYVYNAKNITFSLNRKKIKQILTDIFNYNNNIPVRHNECIVDIPPNEIMMKMTVAQINIDGFSKYICKKFNSIKKNELLLYSDFVSQGGDLIYDMDNEMNNCNEDIWNFSKENKIPLRVFYKISNSLVDIILSLMKEDGGNEKISESLKMHVDIQQETIEYLLSVIEFHKEELLNCLFWNIKSLVHRSLIVKMEL